MTTPRRTMAPNPAVPDDARDLARRLLVHGVRLGMAVEEAEEAVQEVLAKALAHPDWLDNRRGSVLQAMKVTMRNRWIDGHRRTQTLGRLAPKLRLVTPPQAPSRQVVRERAATRRRAFLALLTRDERTLFRAWMTQRDGARAATVATSLGLTVAAYEAAKKRLRRRCVAVLNELELDVTDLFDSGVRQ